MGKALPDTLMKMRSIVSETEKENPPLRGIGVVALTVLLQFIHSLAQKELSIMVTEEHSEASPAFLTFVLACVQVIAAVSVFQVSNLNLTTSPTNREAAIIGVIAYSGGLFLSNYTTWTKETSASACFGIHEPVVCMLLLYTAARISTETNSAGAVVCICLGGALLTTNFTLFGDVGALLHVLASLFLLVRNVVTKHLYDSSVSFALCDQNTIMIMTACGTILAVITSLLVSQALLLASLLAVVTTILSVALLHLLFTLLSLYDILTVAVFMLWSQMLENVIIMTEMAHPGVFSVILGAVMFAVGHYAYFKEGLEMGTVHLNIKQVGVNELFTRLQFILYAGSIVGLTVTLLQPYISDRDIEVLSYVGLDRIARKLLNVHPGEH